jgi:EAL domain-containing protein (putative c-di-GMP-specific phosphodiesterase class I)
MEPESLAPAGGVQLPGLAESLATIAERFERQGVLGVLLVDAGLLGTVESEFGVEARRRSLAALSSTIVEVGRERLDIDDLVVRGEIGRNEVVVLLFREHRDARFYREELPGFEVALRHALERRGHRVFYPYVRRRAALSTGLSVALRNPKFSAESQLRRALEEARQDAELNERLSSRRRRRQLHEVVLGRRVTSVYEPIVDVHSRTVFGYEALARGPAGTELRSPGTLFSLAEQEDVVFELDCLCRASGLEGAVDLPSGTKLFLNIRPTTIHDPNFRADRLIKTLAQCKLSPSEVVFEISEQESIGSFEVFREIRDYYHGLGFQIALDDVGAGYAGLESLLELSPEFIKVDRAFVSGVDQDPARQDLLSALLTVAKRTGAQVIGEGLDTIEELATLGRLGIPFGQGWLFGHPTPLRASE